MTDMQTERITILRRNGISYGEIARLMALPLDTVKSFCRRKHLTTKDLDVPSRPAELTACDCCGQPVVQLPKKKRRRFCSKKCCTQWWNTHQDKVNKKAYYSFICPNCNKEFISYGKANRKFCCHQCYVEYTFHR